MTSTAAPAPHPSQEDLDKAELGVGPRELVVLISSVMALMAVGLDLILPGFDQIREAFDLGDGSNRVGQIITFYFFGLAIAQLIWGPLADRYGRKPVLYAGVGIYLLGAVLSALAPTFGVLLGARVLWGMGAAAARVVATAIIRDRFVGDRMAKAMSQVMAVFVLVPVVAPSLGAIIVAFLPWQAVFWTCAVWAVAVALWSLRLEETLDPAHVRPLSVRQIARTYLEVARIPLSFGYAIATVFLQVAFTLYIANIELIIGDIYDRAGQFPFVFGVVAIGFGISAIINSRLVERFGMDAMIDRGLLVVIVGAVALAVVSVSADGRPAFWLFIFLTGLVLSAFMVLMPNMNTAAMTPVGHIAGSASAFISAIRIGVGSAIAGVITRYIDDSVTPFSISVLGCVLAVVVMVLLIRRLPESQLAAP